MSDHTPPVHDAAFSPATTLPAEVPAVEVTGVSHTYPGAAKAALDEVTFRVEPGEIFGVLGPNGSGKSTLFAILATVIRPSRGSAAIMGHDIANKPSQVRSMLGVVFQHPALDPMLTGRENLMHHGRLHGMQGIGVRDAVIQRLSEVGLADRADQRVGILSGGLRRRIELARAMLHQPHLLLLDEPSVGLDVAARRELWRSLLALRSGNGQSIVLTTHLMDEAERCDRLAVLDGGHLVALDTPARLKAQVGDNVITVELAPQRPGEAVDASTLEQMQRRITERFSPWPAGGEPRIVGGRLFMHHERGAALVEDVTRTWPDAFSHVTVGRPTLEDAFLHLTGHTLTTSMPSDMNRSHITPGYADAPTDSDVV